MAHLVPDSVFHDRWRATWEAMDEAGLRSLAVLGIGAVSQYGNFTFLTGHLPSNKGLYAIMRRGEQPEIIAPTHAAAEGLRAEPFVRGSVAVGGTGDRDAYLDAVASLAERPVGLVAPTPRGLPELDRAALSRHLDGRVVDATGLVEGLRRRVRLADITSLRGAAESAEHALRAFEQRVRVGDSEREAASTIHAELVRRGSVFSIVHVSAGRFHGQPPSDRLIAEGDVVTAFAETAGMAGHWAELGAAYLVGRVSGRRHALAAGVARALDAGSAQLRPGTKGSVVANAMLEATTHLGDPTIPLGHSVSVDEGTVSLSASGDDVLQDRDAFALHPTVRDHGDGQSVGAANTYLIDGDRASALSQYPLTPHLLTA